MATKKSSHDDESLDFKKLEKEVQSAVIYEEKYWRENDAKIRAVEQRVPTYDDFREMVLAAHLKPLEKEDRISSIKNFTQVWNQAADKFSGPNIDNESIGSGYIEQTKITIPKSGQDFVQHWKRTCKSIDEKKNFLFFIGGQRLQEIFKIEISGGLLGEFIECLMCVEPHEVLKSLELLEAFSKSQRFSLSKSFLNKKEKHMCLILFEKLKNSESIKNNEFPLESLVKLQKIYC
ncbi:unnamed protein product [Lymnaea stagnalis]|uniref:Coiled-coil domain-containing protein 103 n=1 Tax=Lymnaea stagnalis TaxID=6523 RepID=A0AAV2H5S1_LYMST